MSEVWAYCRVSTLKTEQELSLEEQGKRAESFARDQSCSIRLFIERKSAKTLTERPVLTNLLNDLESLKPRQRPAFLYATAMDRIARDMVDSSYIAHQLRRLKVRLWIGYEERPLASFVDRLAYLGQSIGGDAENEARSRRSRDSWERRRREGKPTSNKVPYGLQLQGERDIPITDSAEWVLNAYRWYAEGIGAHTIGKRMQGKAPPHRWLTSRIGPDGERIEKIRADTNWESLRVTKLLRQKRYRNTIVPPELFDAVAARLANTPKHGSRTTREYPLTAAMRCKTCRRHLHGRATGHSSTSRRADGTKKVYKRTPIRYYACVVCGYMRNAERLEAEFFARVATLAADEALLRRWVNAPRLAKADVSVIQAEIKRLEAETDDRILRQRRDRLIDAMMATNMSNAEFERQIRRSDDEMHEKRDRLASARRKLAGDTTSGRSLEGAINLLRGFDRLYAQATYEERRHMVSSLADALGGLDVTREGLIWRKVSSATTKLMS